MEYGAEVHPELRTVIRRYLDEGYTLVEWTRVTATLELEKPFSKRDLAPGMFLLSATGWLVGLFGDWGRGRSYVRLYMDPHE